MKLRSQSTRSRLDEALAMPKLPMPKLLLVLACSTCAAASTCAAGTCSSPQPVVIYGIFDADTVDWLRSRIHETLPAAGQARGHLAVDEDMRNTLLDAFRTGGGRTTSDAATTATRLRERRSSMIPCARVAGPQRLHQDVGRDEEDESDVSLLVYTEDDPSSTLKFFDEESSAQVADIEIEAGRAVVFDNKRLKHALEGPSTSTRALLGPMTFMKDAFAAVGVPEGPCQPAANARDLAAAPSVRPGLLSLQRLPLLVPLQRLPLLKRRPFLLFLLPSPSTLFSRQRETIPSRSGFSSSTPRKASDLKSTILFRMDD